MKNNYFLFLAILLLFPTHLLGYNTVKQIDTSAEYHTGGAPIKSAFHESQQRYEREIVLGEPDSFHLPKCNRDNEGMVYFAMGRSQFRAPVDMSLSIFTARGSEWSNFPATIDPGQPEGCPDNPIMALSVKIPFEYPSPVHPKMARFRAMHMQFVTDNYPWYRHNGNRYLFHSLKNNYNACRNITEEIEGCAAVTDGRKQPYSRFKVQYGMNTGDLIQPYYIGCSTMWEKPSLCHVSYEYSPNVRVSYRFKATAFPIIEIVKMDHKLRERIARLQR